jgi:hypothetical protein
MPSQLPILASTPHSSDSTAPLRCRCHLGLGCLWTPHRRTQPTEFLAVAARIIADSGSETSEEIHGGIDKIADQCWSIGAALYFHCTWRWRVAHFDPHNDVAASHHEAGYSTRLTRGHASIMFEELHDPQDRVMADLRRALCTVLGGNWEGTPRPLSLAASAIVIFCADGVDAMTAMHAGGILIVNAAKAAEPTQVLYLGAALYTGTIKGATTAFHLCLLKALRLCRRERWGQVHVVGDNMLAMRQQSTRTAPRRKGHQGAYWKTRCLADAVGVASWTTQPREYNRTAHETRRMAQTTQQALEWVADKDPLRRTRWAAVLAFSGADTSYWRAEQGVTEHGRPPDDAG